MTFDQKILQPGVQRYHVFDSNDAVQSSFGVDLGTLMNASQTNPTMPVLDSSITASGKPSLKFTIPSQSSTGASGQWTMRFAADNSVQYGAGETFAVQWMQKIDRYFFEHFFTNGGGWKQAICGSADGSGCSTGNTTNCSSSCSDLEVVLQNTNQRGFPQMYNSCGTFTPFEISGLFGSDLDVQPHQGASPSFGTYCSYQGLPGTTNCYTYAQGLASGGDQVTQWGTFTVQIALGSDSGGFFQNSNVKAWVSWAGGAASKMIDYTTNLISSGSQKYGRVWLLPYHSGKSDTEVHTETYTWYANPIVFTGAIDSSLLTTDEPASGSKAVILR